MIRGAEQKDHSFTEFLFDVTTYEQERREEKQLEKRFKSATFPLHKTIDILSSPSECGESRCRGIKMCKDADIYLYAHICKPYIRFLNGKCIINTGSVGMPFDGIVKSSYALVEVGEGGF